jgi:hypothetical protein
MQEPALTHPGEVILRPRFGVRLSPVHFLTGGSVLLLTYLTLVPLLFLLYGSLTSASDPGTFTFANYVRAYTDAAAFRLLIRDVAGEVARLAGNHRREVFVNAWLRAFADDLRDRARAGARDDARLRQEGRQAEAQVARRAADVGASAGSLVRESSSVASSSCAST